jgi:hypothetical protein
MSNREIAIDTMGLEDDKNIIEGFEYEGFYYIQYEDGMFHCIVCNDEAFNKDEEVIKAFINTYIN